MNVTYSKVQLLEEKAINLIVIKKSSQHCTNAEEKSKFAIIALKATTVRSLIVCSFN